MIPKVWNMELPQFPREGLNHLMPSDNCQVAMKLRSEATKLARLSQMDLPSPLSMNELKSFQKKLRKKLFDAVGVKYDPSLPLDVHWYDTVECENFSIRKLIYQSRKDFYVTALLFVPRGEGPFPGVIHMHGHSNLGKLYDVYLRAVSALASSGYVCLTVDAFGNYERATKHGERDYHGGFLGCSLFNIGETLMGVQLVDNMRGVDLLSSLPFVQKDKIGATGASGGGNQTMYLAAMDTRVTAAMPIVSAGSFESYVTGVNCVCEQLPDGLTFTEEAGVLSLIAPRALRIGNAYFDVNRTFAVDEMLKTYRQVEKVYRDIGAADNIAYTVAHDVHGMKTAQIEAMIGWFNWKLKNSGCGGTVDVPENILPGIEKLQVFANAEDRPALVRPMDVHCNLNGKILRAEMLAKTSFSRKKAIDGLKKVLRFKPFASGGILKAYCAKNSFERYSLEIGDHLIPFVIKRGTVPGKFRLLLHPEGKAQLSDEEIARYSADGSTLAICDLFGEGETAQQNIINGIRYQLLRQLLWLGRSLPGEWVKDILAMVNILKKRFHAEELDVTGIREAGTCAVFAGALSAEKFSVTPVDSPASLLFRRDSIPTFRGNAFVPKLANCLYSAMLGIPGFLKWGDVSLAAALMNGEVDFVSPRAYDGTPYSDDEKADLLKEIADLKKKIK